MSEVTRILHAIDGGDARAADRLLPLVYEELRRLAARKLSLEKPGQTLDATGLVHEAYVRLVSGDVRDGSKPRRYRDCRHFFVAAATAIRRILVDNARRKQAQKHGGGLKRHEIETLAALEPSAELMALDEALQKLAEKEPLKARLVELRFFAGLTGEEAARVLGISPTTADRHWAYARAWLQTEVRES